MTRVSYLIIGGGIAGTTAAETIRNLDNNSSIWIVNAEHQRLYSRVMLPHYVKGLVNEERLFLRTQDWYTQRNIELKLATRLIHLDPLSHQAELSSGEIVHYEKLLLATGGSPSDWKVPGSKRRGVVPFWTLENARELKALVSDSKETLVVGGGFIMADLVSIFHHLRLSTQVVIRKPHLFYGCLDPESADIIKKALEKVGITVNTNSEVTAVEGNLKVNSVMLNNKESLPCQIVGLGVGLVSDFKPLDHLGIVDNGGIKTNEYLETSVPDVYAAGDVANFYDVYLGTWHKLGNWTNAQEQGKIAGLNMVGETRHPFALVTSHARSFLGVDLITIGEVEIQDNVEEVKRGGLSSGKIARFLSKDKRLIGATLINMPELRQEVIQLIKGRIDLSAHHAKLVDEGGSLGLLVN